VLRPGTILGQFQNGVGNDEAPLAALPEQALLAGSLTVRSAWTSRAPSSAFRGGGVALAPVSPEVNVRPLVVRCANAGFKSRRYTTFAR